MIFSKIIKMLIKKWWYDIKLCLINKKILELEKRYDIDIFNFLRLNKKLEREINYKMISGEYKKLKSLKKCRYFREYCYSNSNSNIKRKSNITDEEFKRVNGEMRCYKKQREVILNKSCYVTIRRFKRRRKLLFLN